MKSAEQMYEKRKNSYDKLLQRQKKADRKTSNIRLMVFIAGICAAVYTGLAHNYILLAAASAVFIVMFIYLVIYQEKLLRRMKYSSLLLDINSTSLKRINGEWNKFEDAGEDFVEDNHSYSGDLDIFGKGSLYQWINAAKTFVGREMLRDLLLGEVGSKTDIYERQAAVKELAAMLNWRQRFSAEGMATLENIHNPDELMSWGKERNAFYSKPWVIAGFRFFPVITVLLVTAGFFMNIIPKTLPAIALFIQFAMVSYNVKGRYRVFAIFEKYNKDLRVYYKMLKHFENRQFKTDFINKIKGNLRSSEGVAAYKQVDKLSSIVDSLSNRRNLFYIFFNVLTLWDFQGIIALEAWKKESGDNLNEWLDAIGRMEALTSLAIICFENPDWIVPEIKDEKEAVLEAKALGHPLLIGKRVHNDLIINEKVKVILITGSNMSGKSTLLRTVGINLVLAYAGAPVCAQVFTASMMEIYTCMRVKDNLEESISSFYAELLRIKKIVKESEAGKKVFFLLDEIFKGTNSQDRHAGARVLINKLSLTNAIGMVSTHDLELCDLEQKNDKIANYHFQEFYEAESIYFDYKLRQGPSTTRNALHLMRLAGIEVE